MSIRFLPLAKGGMGFLYNSIWTQRKEPQVISMEISDYFLTFELRGQCANAFTFLTQKFHRDHGRIECNLHV